MPSVRPHPHRQVPCWLGEDGIFWNHYKEAQLIKRHGHVETSPTLLCSSPPTNRRHHGTFDVNGGAVVKPLRRSLKDPCAEQCSPSRRPSTSSKPRSGAGRIRSLRVELRHLRFDLKAAAKCPSGSHGNEFCGEIVAVGLDAWVVEVGDHVARSPHRLRTCLACLKATSSLCQGADPIASVAAVVPTRIHQVGSRETLPPRVRRHGDGGARRSTLAVGLRRDRPTARGDNVLIIGGGRLVWRSPCGPAIRRARDHVSDPSRPSRQCGLLGRPAA